VKLLLDVRGRIIKCNQLGKMIYETYYRYFKIIRYTADEACSESVTKNIVGGGLSVLALNGAGYLNY